MNITGIIAEYNPFHNGHQYQLDWIRTQLGSDYMIVLMNGDFTQRGEAALLNKYHRTSMALHAGADLVLELPVMYGTGSAEYFASGSIRLLHELGCISNLCFGCECENLELLQTIADIFSKEPESYRQELTQQLKAGISFPKARVLALNKYSEEQGLNLPMSADILQQPNVILAIEYLKALQKETSPITPVLLKRTDSGYHSMNLGKYSSASAIRAAYEQNGPADALRQALPEQVFQLLSQAYTDCAPMKTEYFYPYMQYSLWKPRRPLHELQDITPDLCNRLLGNYKPEYTYAQYLEQVLNKQYTRTRIQRSLIHILLDITKEQVALQKSSDTMHYARILGFRKESSALLRYLRSHSSIPLIQKAASAPSILGWENQTALQLFEQDIQASHLYEQVCYQHFHHSIYNEYTTGVIVSED